MQTLINIVAMFLTLATFKLVDMARDYLLGLPTLNFTPTYTQFYIAMAIVFIGTMIVFTIYQQLILKVWSKK